MDRYQETFDILFDDILTMPQDISENEKKLVFKCMDLLEEACDKANKYDYLTMILNKCQVLETPNGIYLCLHSEVEDFEGMKNTINKIFEERK